MASAVARCFTINFRSSDSFLTDCVIFFLLRVKVLTTLGTYFESFLPGSLPWPSMVLASLLVCSLLTMAILVIVDPVLRTWMKHSLRPSSKMTCSSTTSTTSSRRTCTESTTLDNVLHPFGGSTAALHPPGKIGTFLSFNDSFCTLYVV